MTDEIPELSEGQLCETGPMGPPGRWVKTLCASCAAAGHRGRTYTPVERG